MILTMTILKISKLYYSQSNYIGKCRNGEKEREKEQKEEEEDNKKGRKEGMNKGREGARKEGRGRNEVCS